MEDFVTVATFLSLADAEPSRLALEAAGIPTLATDENMGSLLGTTMVGGIKLQVAQADAERAAELLDTLEAESPPEATDEDEDDEAEEAEGAADGVSLKCPRCGADIWYPAESRGTTETCPECGAQVPIPA